MWVILFSLFCWTTPLLAEDCSYPKNAEFSKTPVEVYQIRHLDTANGSTTIITIQIDLMRDSVRLPSKTLCKYSTGGCYDPKTEQEYTWNNSKNFSRTNTTCNHLAHFIYDINDSNYTYSLLTLRRDPLVMFVIAENSLSIYCLQLLEEEIFCGKNVWRTDQRNLIVAVGEENFIEAAYETEDSLLQPIGISVYDLGSREEAYSGMMSKCEQKDLVEVKLDQYRDEIAELRGMIRELQKELTSRNSELSNLRQELDQVHSVKTTVHNLQKKLNKYRQENNELKQNLGRLEEDVEKDVNEATEILDVDFDKTRLSENIETIRALPQTFSNVFNGYRNCPDYILFPYENIFCILIAILYVFFSVVNTVMNYFSMRMLLTKKQRWCFFYTLTNGLTTRYICRSQLLTRRKIDKWLLDLE